MKLAEWARQQNVAYSTAYKWWKDGILPVKAVQMKTQGSILIDVVPETEGETAIYARVSSAQQSDSLTLQVARLTEWATTNGHRVDHVVKEIGSGLNGKRSKFKKLLTEPKVTTIIAEHRDRFARFGCEYIEAALGAQGRRLIVVSDEEGTEESDDLLQDITDVLTSLCARFYGKRGAAARAKAAVKVAAETQDEQAES